MNDHARYIRVPFDSKDDAKTIGARWDATNKCWFIPFGVDPMLLRQWWAYLDCPFEEKDEARRLGARWDKTLKSWYVPIGVDFDDFQDWWPAWVSERMELPEQEAEEIQWHEVDGELGGKYTFSFSEDYRKSGGTAQVFFGWKIDIDSGEIEDSDLPSVAIKNFYVDEDSLDFTMFQREVDALRQLNGHPNVVSLIDYGFDTIDRTFFIVTEYMQFSMADVLTMSRGDKITYLGEEISGRSEEEEEEDKSQKTPEDNWKEEADWLEQILQGLVHSLQSGIYHRDLKPGNILCAVDDTDDFSVKLCDFGIASKAQGASGDKTVSFIGTETYTPPDHKNSHKHPGTRDVYSWGVIAIEALSEQHLEDRQDVEAALENEVKPYFPVPMRVFRIPCHWHSLNIQHVV
jgi:hypothetical protein